jgi:hypothetical protein
LGNRDGLMVFESLLSKVAVSVWTSVEK